MSNIHNVTVVEDFMGKIYKNRFGEEKQVSNNDDILAHSVAWHRLRKMAQNPEAAQNVRTTLNEISGLTSSELAKNVGDLDRAKAAEIRKYYTQKIMLWNLRGKELTEFRKSLADFFAHEAEYYIDNQLGMIYRLPEFYEYDQQIDALREEHGCTPFPRESRRGFRATVATLQPLRKVERNTRTGKFVHYWMKNIVEDGKLVMLRIEHGNQLRHLWEDIFDTGTPLTVTGGFSYSCRDDLEHYILEGWKLVK